MFRHFPISLVLVVFLFMKVGFFQTIKGRKTVTTGSSHLKRTLYLKVNESNRFYAPKGGYRYSRAGVLLLRALSGSGKARRSFSIISNFVMCSDLPGIDINKAGANWVLVVSGIALREQS